MQSAFLVLDAALVSGLAWLTTTLSATAREVEGKTDAVAQWFDQTGFAR